MPGSKPLAVRLERLQQELRRRHSQGKHCPVLLGAVRPQRQPPRPRRKPQQPPRGHRAAQNRHGRWIRLPRPVHRVLTRERSHPDGSHSLTLAAEAQSALAAAEERAAAALAAAEERAAAAEVRAAAALAATEERAASAEERAAAAEAQVMQLRGLLPWLSREQELRAALATERDQLLEQEVQLRGALRESVQTTEYVKAWWRDAAKSWWALAPGWEVGQIPAGEFYFSPPDTEGWVRLPLVTATSERTPHVITRVDGVGLQVTALGPSHQLLTLYTD